MLLSRHRGPQLGRLSLRGRDSNRQRAATSNPCQPLGLRFRFPRWLLPEPSGQRRTSGVRRVSARHLPRQKSGRARDQSQSAVSRHRSERSRPRLSWHSQCPSAGIGRGTECGAWLDAPRFAAKPQVQGRLASRLRRRPCRSRDLVLMAGLSTGLCPAAQCH